MLNTPTHAQSTLRTGADFHRAMVATAPGEKLRIGRRPVRNWTRRAISSLILCRKSHLFLEKSTKTAATRAALFDSNMHSAPSNPLAVFRGPTSKGRGGSLSFTLGRKKQSRRLWLTACHCEHSLSAGHAAIDRYLLPAGPTAANLQQPDYGTDGRTPYRCTDPDPHATRAVSVVGARSG